MFLRAAFVLVAMLISPQVGFSEILGPADKIDALRSQPEQKYPFIVRFASGTELSPERLGLSSDKDEFYQLDLINALAGEMVVANAFELSQQEDIVQVWYLHPNLAPLYIRTIAALDYNVKTLPLPSLVNLSITPAPTFWRKTPYENEPIHAATKAAAEAGLVPIVAIGNSNHKDGWINPWCWPEWIICVGAYDQRQGAVAEFSSRGHAGEPMSWPDVIAQGVDVIGPYPTGKKKSAQRKKRDEEDEQFRALVSEDEWSEFTLESGTSQSAAITSGAAAQILHFLQGMIASHDDPTEADPLFSLSTTPDRQTEYAKVKTRLTGIMTQEDDGTITFVYKLDEPWKMIKQLLVDTAIPLPDAKPSEVGAGIVDPAYIREQFGQFGVITPKIFPTKVLE